MWFRLKVARKNIFHLFSISFTFWIISMFHLSFSLTVDEWWRCRGMYENEKFFTIIEFPELLSVVDYILIVIVLSSLHLSLSLLTFIILTITTKKQDFMTKTLYCVKMRWLKNEKGVKNFTKEITYALYALLRPLTIQTQVKCSRFEFPNKSQTDINVRVVAFVLVSAKRGMRRIYCNSTEHS